MKNKTFLRAGIIALIILLAAFSRLIPIMPNFSPLGAICLFGAAYFASKWQAVLIPLAAVWLSDLFINNVIYAAYNTEFTWFYEGFYWQYGSYLMIVIAGLLLFSKVNPQRILAGTLASTIIFFLISNFGVWIGSNMYPKDFTGLMACYAAGIPFIKGTFMGDLIYSVVLFGSFAIAQKQFIVLRPTLQTN